MLQSFLEHEELESQAIAERLVSQIHTHGLAVTGTSGTMQALKSGQADFLVIVKNYDPGMGWECRRCGKIELNLPRPNLCPACQIGLLREFDIREEMVRLAGRLECGVEVVEHSDVLMNLGGVGCLLRSLAPAGYIHAAALSGAGSAPRTAAAELPLTYAWSASSVATGILHYQWSPSATTAALRRYSNPMPISVPNYNCKTDRHQFGTLIGITSDGDRHQFGTLIGIPRNPHK